MRWRYFLAAFVALTTLGAAQAQTVPGNLQLQRIPNASTLFSFPIGVRAPNDNSGRLFVIEKCGTIRVIKNGALLPTPFLSTTVNGGCSGLGDERGLLGLAFHPNFSTNRKFYISYTRAAGGTPLGSTSDQVVAEYLADASNGDIADATTRREIIAIPDLASNHNGGDIHFGADGFLYYSMGDGGPQNDPNEFAQNIWRRTVSGRSYYLLGKIMRLDIDGTTANASAELCGTVTGQTAQYRIPASNPLVGSTDSCDEIFHRGFRNPWRFSFDLETGEMYIGDVGQNTIEEVDVAPASVPTNFGWKCFEGTNTFFTTGACNPLPANLVGPILQYSHGARCSIVGGYRYRGPIVALRGAYFYGDSCTGEIFIGIQSGANWTSSVWNTVPAESGFPYSLVGFGQSQNGRLFAADAGGKLYEITVPDTESVFANGFE